MISGLYVGAYFEDQLPVNLISVRAIDAEFEHERAVISLLAASPDTKRFETGAPVRIVWGRKPDEMRTFVGYVNHTVPEAKGGPRHATLKVVCVGPSWRMKAAGYRTYRNVSVSHVVRDIAADYRFDTVNVFDSERTWPVLHQSGKSDWQFLCECAHKVGWTLFVRGTSLFFMDYARAVRYGLDDFTVITPRDRGGPNTNRFEGEIGRTSPNGGDLAVRDAYGINPRTKRVLAKRNKADSERSLTSARAAVPVFNTAQTEVVFDDFGEIGQDLKALEDVNRLSVPGTLVGPTRPRARTGSVVQITGFGPGDDGHWFVRSSDHQVFSLQESEMELALGRDSTQGGAASHLKRPNSRGSRLLNGKWVRG